VFPVRWFNASSSTVVPADKDSVARVIEGRFKVKLTLLGGPVGSGGYRSLFDDIDTNGRLGPNDAKRRTLPDIFPWSAGYGYPRLSDLFAPLPVDLIRRAMPRTWTDIQVTAAKQGLDPAQVWTPFKSNGVIYAIPQPNPGWEFPTGVVWRADALDQLGFGVPTTIEDWEAVFRAWRQEHPDRIPWTGVRANLPYLPLFDATGLEMTGFVLRDGRVQPAMVQPEMRRALQTLRRWYVNGYVAMAAYGTAFDSADTNGLFIAGRNIVTADARPEDGSWVTREPYVVGSIEDLAARRVPGASFVMAPRPVFNGVSSAVARGQVSPFGALCFGFSKELESQPEKLERIMGMVDTLASDTRMYLTAMYGIEGSQWTWQRTSAGRYPQRIPSTTPVNTGRYWIFPWSPHDDEFGMSPRVKDSITRLFGSPASLYGTGAPARPLFSVPYADTGSRALQDKERFQKLINDAWSRFYEQVFFPIVYNNAGLSAFDDFVSWYAGSGGEELEQILTRWAGR
jgi:hypothetical protein